MTARHMRITADERKIKDFPKLPSAASFIRRTLSEISKWGDSKNRELYGII